MIKLLFSLLLGLASIQDEGDTLYTMRGKPWNPDVKTTYMTMYYSPNSCHACVNQLWQYILDECSQAPDHQPLLIVEGGDILSMRNQTRYLHDTFGESVNIYYDNPPQGERKISDKYEIRYFPCLFIITNKTQFQYFSYAELFRSSEKK